MHKINCTLFWQTYLKSLTIKMAEKYFIWIYCCLTFFLILADTGLKKNSLKIIKAFIGILNMKHFQEILETFSDPSNLIFN